VEEQGEVLAGVFSNTISWNQEIAHYQLKIPFAVLRRDCRGALPLQEWR
jgi:hypothetical protein